MPILRAQSVQRAAYCATIAPKFLMSGLFCSVLVLAVYFQASIAQAQLRVAETNTVMPQGLMQPASASAQQPASTQQHPLEPALKMAWKVQENMKANLHDYSATIVKHERIDGKLGDPEYALIKVRQQPFSVYLGFIGPEDVKGQECMYVEGQNNGKMFAHAPPGTFRYRFGTVSLDPTSAMAMRGQRYPITEIGISNLTKRLIEVGDHDKQFGECDVQFFQGSKVNGRVCTMIQVTHPVPRANFLFHMARIYLDDELQVPIRYEAYDWPTQAGGPPVLLEEYTYMNLKVNEGLTDADFDVHNAKYSFNVK
ncbi:MAG TPA: DUF1571 domain-containing protein [Pirellulales bacterium]|jgi:hypothetical protein|nr:DUF1571 domain-containing protein [Pirellulales bacterium]